MNNPLTGKLEPFTYDVEIWNGNHIVTIITVRNTNEEEAIIQAVKQLKTIVKRKS